jgi:hypothetical protein
VRHVASCLTAGNRTRHRLLQDTVHDPALFKETVSQDGYFLEGLNILISTFCVCADGFQGLSTAFHNTIFIFLFASLK